MVSIWALLVLLTTSQLVQSASLRNCSNSLKGDELNCGTGHLHLDDHAKQVHVGFDDMFYFDQLSRSDGYERRKRETEDIIETDAEIFSNGPETSLNIQSMPMTTLDDTESNFDNKELKYDRDQEISENIKSGAERNTGVEETDGKEERSEQEEKTFDISNIIRNIESAEQDSIPDSNKDKESKVADLSIEKVQDSSIDHNVQITVDEGINHDETKANKVVKEDSVSEAESDLELDSNDEHSMDPFRNELGEPLTNDQVEMIQSSAQSSDAFLLAQIKQSDDEDEDFAESGSGADEDGTAGSSETFGLDTKDNESPISNLSSVNDIIVEGDINKGELEEEEEEEEKEEEKEETPLSAPNLQSKASISSVTKQEEVKSDNNDEEGTVITEKTPYSSETNPSISNNYSIESDSDDEEHLNPDSPFITTSLNKSRDTLPNKEISGSGDDTRDDENTTLVESENSLEDGSADIDIPVDAGRERNQVDPLPTPIENSEAETSQDNANFNIENTDDDYNDDVLPISNPTLEEVFASNSAVDDDQKSGEELGINVGVSHPTDKDSGEGSGNSSIDDSGETDGPFPPVISKVFNDLGSGPTKDKDVNTRPEGPHVKGVSGELPNPKKDDDFVDVPFTDNQKPNIDPATEVGTNVKEIPSTDGVAGKELKNSINEIGVTTDDKKNTSVTDTSTSSGSYIVLGAIMVTIIGLLGYTVIKSQRQKQKKKNLRNKPKDEEAGTELKEIEKLLNRELQNSKGPANGFGGESDVLLSSKRGESDEIPSSKISYPAERPNIPSNGFATHTQIPTGLSEVTVENVPTVFATVPITANGGQLIPRVTQSDTSSANGSDDDSSDDRGSWVYGNIPLETTKIKTYIDHDSIPKTPIVIVKRGGSTVEM